jgi:hypothetical protein
MPDAPDIETLAWKACTADCQRLGVRRLPCADCRAVARRMVVHMTRVDLLPFAAARQILDQAPRAPADAPA